MCSSWISHIQDFILWTAAINPLLLLSLKRVFYIFFIVLFPVNFVGKYVHKNKYFIYKKIIVYILDTGNTKVSIDAPIPSSQSSPWHPENFVSPAELGRPVTPLPPALQPGPVGACPAPSLSQWAGDHVSIFVPLAHSCHCRPSSQWREGGFQRGGPER